MNNKGFSLIELIITISIISVITVVSMVIINNTFGLTAEKSYDIFKKSITTQISNYIYECDNGIIECTDDYFWKKEGNKEKTSFYLSIMKKYSYFSETDYINPITEEEVSDCLKIIVTKDELATLDIKLNDELCQD